jgi:hypothetical protein
MSCPLTAGYTLGCRDSQGGVDYVIAIEKANIVDITVDDGEVTAIQLEEGSQGWKIEQEQATAMFEDNPIGDRANGTYRAEQNVTLVLNDRRKETRNLINLLAKNRLVFVVKENTGRYSLAGLERGLMLADGTGGTGTAHADRNGASLPFTGVEREVAPTVDPEIVAALLEPAE